MGPPWIVSLGGHLGPGSLLIWSPWACSSPWPPAVYSFLNYLSRTCHFRWLGAGSGDRKLAGWAVWYHGQSRGCFGQDWDGGAFILSACSLPGRPGGQGPATSWPPRVCSLPLLGPEACSRDFRPGHALQGRPGTSLAATCSRGKAAGVWARVGQTECGGGAAGPAPCCDARSPHTAAVIG